MMTILYRTLRRIYMKALYPLAALLLTGALLSGCGGDGTKQSAGTVVPPAASSSQIPAEKEASLTYYLPTEDGLHILPSTVKVKAADRTAKTAIEEMLRADRKSKYPLVPAGTRLKSIHIEDGTCTVNFTKELNQLQGETGQSLFIAMTVDTLTEFPNIKRVEFRAEGQLVKFQIDMRKQFLRDEAFIQQTKK